MVAENEGSRRISRSDQAQDTRLFERARSTVQETSPGRLLTGPVFYDSFVKNPKALMIYVMFVCLKVEMGWWFCRARAYYRGYRQQRALRN